MLFLSSNIIALIILIYISTHITLIYYLKDLFLGFTIDECHICIGFHEYFGSHFKGLIFLMVFSTNMLGFACLRNVWSFWPCEPKHVNGMKILGPCGSKKVAKESQRLPIWTSRGQYHGPGGSRRSSGAKQKAALGPLATTSGPLPSWLLDFFVTVWFISVLTGCSLDFHNKS